MKNVETSRFPSLYGIQMKQGNWFTTYAYSLTDAEDRIVKMADRAQDFIDGGQVQLLDQKKFKEVSSYQGTEPSRAEQKKEAMKQIEVSASIKPFSNLVETFFDLSIPI